MTAIYLHGFNSDSNSTTIRELKKKIPGLISISYDYINADIAYKQINSLIVETLKSGPDLLIAGTSLGGFWANYFAQKFHLKCVIVNPSLHPSDSLKRAVAESPIKNFNSGEERTFTDENAAAYEKYEEDIKPGISRTIVLGKNDELIDYRKAEEAFKGKGTIILTDEGHRIEDYGRIVKIIEEAAAFKNGI